MRKYLATIIINAVVALSLMSIAAGADVLPNRGLYEVSHERVELRGGFWGPRLKTHHETTIGHALDCLERNGHVTNFDKAAGVFDGPLRGHHAFDSDIHKALEGALYSLQHRDDSQLRKRVEGILDRILAAQQKDGFLISCFIVNGLDKKWDDLRLQHQMYNAGHFFEMAVEHHRLSGEKKAIDAAKRFADHIDGIFGPGKRYDVPGHEEIELALVKLYRATGERRYLELSRFLLDERGHLHGTERRSFESGPLVVPERVKGQTDAEYRRAKWHASLRWRNGRMQDHKPLVEQNAIGHAVRAGYIYSAMADIARFMDAPDYEQALDRIWHDVVSRKMYVNGGIGTAQYHDEGFGDPYLLPNRTYCESCAGIAHVLWQHRMNLLKGQAKYADVMELVLYNGAISGISISGNGFFYQNPLESKGARRSSWIGLACCPTNLTRIIPQVGGLAYARSEKNVYVNLYLAGEASVRIDHRATVKLAQKTEYPWSGRVRLTVTPDQASEFTLCLRIPGWASGQPVPSNLYRFAEANVPPVVLKINGKTADASPKADGYVHLKRRWQAGDEVELDLPMPINRVYAHQNVKADQGKVSLMRGPITYCIEAVDNPNVDVLSAALPREAELRAEHRDRLLGGVTVLQGKGLDGRQRPVTLTAVPYYSWANREKGAMTIWINEAPIASAALLAASSPVLAQQANQSTTLKQGGKSPIKVFILAGQSNMQGQGVVDMDDPKDYNGGLGNLEYVMANSPLASMYTHLKDANGQWTVRDDVWVRYKTENRGLLKGGLTIGFTGYGGTSHIGPELQFGHVIGDHLSNQVLLIKTAWGGKSLYADFRPPSSGGKVGHYYTKMLDEVQDALDNLGTDFPGYDEAGGHEIAGFVWFQGWNDMISSTATAEYTANLINLAADIRSEFNLPNLPIVIGELGTTGPALPGTGMQVFRDAQAAAAEAIDNAVFVETTDFARPAEESPNTGHGHHWYGNAESYFLVGNALGEGMKKLLMAAQPRKGPLKVFILAGQSNMDGQANVKTIDFLGEDKEHGALLKTFKPDGKTLVTRDDVWVAHRGVYGNLAPGYGGRRPDDKLGNNIGPEYAFGYFMGEAMDEQVLLIKIAGGGTSLYRNWRPPSTGLPAGAKAEDIGGMYKALTEYTHETLDNLKKHFPAYDEKAGYEIAGFVWFQGYNDMFDETGRKEYGTNLVHLIKDLRKEFKAPEMRVVVGVMGVNGPRNEINPKQKDVRNGQRFVNTVPELKGNVKAIETGQLLHPQILELKCAGWLYPERDIKKTPITAQEQAMLKRATSNQGYHYFGSGRFFILLGKSFAETMQKLMKKRGKLQ